MNIVNGCKVCSEKKIILCGDKICCPTLEKIGENLYKLTDDDGNSVVITSEQAKLLNNGISLFNSNQSLTKEQVICG